MERCGLCEGWGPWGRGWGCEGVEPMERTGVCEGWGLSANTCRTFRDLVVR